MNKTDEEIMKKIPKNKIGIACFDYIIQGVYKKILDDLLKIDSNFKTKLEVKYEQGKEIKERVVFYIRNKKNGLCFTFAVDEEKEEFILYYIYRSEFCSLPDDEKDIRDIFKIYQLDEYDNLLDTLKLILKGFRIKSLIELKKAERVLKFKVVDKVLEEKKRD